MIGTYFIFNTLSNLIIFLSLCFGAGVWAYYNLKRNREVGLVPLILIAAALFLIWGKTNFVNGDEVEHLHCSWMVHAGLTPYRDFWQHHLPFLWVMLAPAFGFLKPSGGILVLSRFFSGAIFLVIALLGWGIGRAVWRERFKVSMYLFLVACSGIIGQFLFLRPDLFMTLFLLIGVYLCLGMRSGRAWVPFCAGLAFALSGSFHCAQYCMFLLAPVVIISQRHKRWRLQLSAYLAGVIAGSLPLLSYLLSENILKEFIYWVLVFNRQRMVVSTLYPLGLAFIAVRGTVLLWRRYRTADDYAGLVICVAFYLCTFSTLMHTVFNYSGYKLMPWLILCAIAGSGQAIKEIVAGCAGLRLKSVAAGVLLAALLTAHSDSLLAYRQTDFKTDKRMISELIRYSEKDSCLVLLPYHPIFTRDATWLYAYWQFFLSEAYTRLRTDIKSRHPVEQVMRMKPAVVLCGEQQRDFLLEMLQKRLISFEEHGRLRAFLRANYTVRRIGRNRYYIRNDKLR